VTDYAKALGTRLRAIRTQQGLSLHGVELKSQGRWKAVVVGSYERGDRAVTVQRLSELCDFYGVPVNELLPDSSAANAVGPASRIIIDLEQLSSVPADQAAPLARYAATIQSQRGDYNGRVRAVDWLGRAVGRGAPRRRRLSFGSTHLRPTGWASGSAAGPAVR
jgi:transcriptional regulator with XRE-family HTH domain